MIGCDCEWFPAPPGRISPFVLLLDSRQTHPLSLPIYPALKPLQVAGSVFSRRRLLSRESRRSRPHALGADILTLEGIPRGLRRHLLAGRTLTSRRRTSLWHRQRPLLDSTVPLSQLVPVYGRCMPTPLQLLQVLCRAALTLLSS